MERIHKETKKIFPGEGKNSFYDVYDTTVKEQRECKEMIGMTTKKTFKEVKEEMENHKK